MSSNGVQPNRRMRRAFRKRLGGVETFINKTVTFRIQHTNSLGRVVSSRGRVISCVIDGKDYTLKLDKFGMDHSLVKKTGYAMIILKDGEGEYKFAIEDILITDTII